MKIVITNAGRDGMKVAHFLEKRLSQRLPISDITTKGCWLIISRNGPLTNEMYFPCGEVSFELDPVEYCPNCLVRILTDYFKGEGFHFVIPGIPHFTIA